MKPSDECFEAPFLNLADPDFSVRSEAVREARNKCWYARTPYGIAVLRYAEIGSLLRDARLRQGSYRWPAHNRASGLFAEWWLRMLLNRVGTDHDRLRRLVNPAFSPRLVTPLIPRFEAIAEEIIMAFKARGRCEFMSEFAAPFSTRVICEVLGLSHDQWGPLADASADMGLALGVTYEENQCRVNAATKRLFDYAQQLVAERRARPRDDFVSNLIKANEDKERLGDQELYDMIVLAISGGIETTRNQLGLGMSLFLDHPEQWKLLNAQHKLARNAVEEIMRLRPTTTWVTREPLEDITINGLVIEKGTTVHLFAESGGTDPRVFDSSVDIATEHKRHYGFGAGPHYCLGQAIARSDMTEAFRLLSRHLIEPQYDGAPAWLPDSGNTGPIKLPIKFKL
ncbi:cytochrome P450 [Hyphomicrobium sp. 2TAF46]|uniref:cytochrome P450 n=1 Tax=Hyphomicrobium sp. 2TAF46 TaxID=3233019 RepID=UPI003F90B394